MCSLAACLALAVPGAASAVEEATPILPLEEVRVGQTGYGLSVFSGSRPQRFELEVVGVWRQVRPDISYILARLQGMGLEKTGVVAGMSGSPVFIDDRLAGAVAFSWPFASEPIAGITPIEAMRELTSPGTEGAVPAAGDAPASLDQLLLRRLPEHLLPEQLSLLSPRLTGNARSALQWTAIGFGEPTRSLLSEALGPVTGAGTSAAGGEELMPGESVAGVLIDGDLRLAVTGTVTERTGERILAFGHPFLGMGPVRLPMATSEVVTVIPSMVSSFKLANLGRVVGAIDLDRATGVRGQLGLEAPMIPLGVKVRGGRSRDFSLRLASVPQVTPSLAAISLLASLEATTQASGGQGIDLLAEIRMRDHASVNLSQSFDGDAAAGEAAVYLLALTGYLMNNRLAEVEVTGIDLEVAQSPRPRTARLIEAHASQTLVRPGERLMLNLDLMAFRGERFRRSISLELPTDLPEGRYSLLVGDGVSADGARFALEKTDPVNFQQALGLLRSLHSSRQLVVLGVFGGEGLAVAGEVLPRLPPSVRSLWGAAGAGSAVPLRLAVTQLQVQPLEEPAEGLLRVDLRVRRQEAMTVTPGASLAGAGDPELEVQDGASAESASEQPPGGESEGSSSREPEG